MEQEYVKLKPLDRIIHFSPSLYFAVAFLIAAIIITIKGLFDLEMLTMLALVFSIPTAIFYTTQKQKLQFRLVKISINQEEFKELVNEISKEHQWTINSHAGNEYALKTNPGFMNQSWGQHITLRLIKDGILFNSICDTNKGAWLVAFGSTNRNMNVIEKIIQERKKVLTPS